MGFWLQRIGIITTATLGILLSPILMAGFLQGDMMPLAIFMAVLFLVYFFSCNTKKQWMLIPCLAMIPGSLNFLPLNFSPMELFIVLVLLHFFIAEIIFKKERISLGDPLVTIFISIVFLIIMYHWCKQGIGLRVMGGDTVGARKNFSIVLGVVAYVLIVTCCKNQMDYLNKFPFYYLLAALAGAAPSIISAILPSTARYLYYFTGSATFEADTSMDVVAAADIGRMGYLGPIANAIQLFLICRYSIKTWWEPHRWWVLGLSLLAFYLSLKSGFRNAVFTFAIISFAGAFCRLGWKCLFGVIPVALLLSVLTLGHGTLFELPYAVQRSISFLPGDWAPEVIQTTNSSDEFRKQIKDIYIEEYAKKSPIFGNGFNYDAREVTGIITFAKWDTDPYNFHKGFIIRKDFHVGWISLYDPIGLVGAVGFIGLFFACLSLIMRCMKFWTPERRPPIVVWLFTQLIATVATYFTVFGALQQTMPLLCIYAAMIVAVRREVIALENSSNAFGLSEVEELPAKAPQQVAYR